MISNSFALAISEYETTIDSLTLEIAFYIKEQENLRSELTILGNENKTLAETVKQLFEWQTNHQCITYPEKSIDSELVDNLKAQLVCVQKEKNLAINLWQNALKTIDHLEGALDLCDGRTHGYVTETQFSNMKISYNNKITQLEQQVQKYQSDLDNCKKTLDAKNKELLNATERQTSARVFVKHLEDDAQDFNKRLKDLVKVRDELQADIETKKQTIADLHRKEAESKRKVTEALQIVEAACLEKDAALARENETKKEVMKMSNILSEMMDETTENVKTETGYIKQVYGNKLQNVQVDVLNLQKELKEKDAELTKCLRQSMLLNQELDKIRNGNVCGEESHTSKLLILEKNLESTFQKLLLAEKKNLQLDAEKESIKFDLEQMANCYKSDIRTRETEKEVMKKELQTLRVQLRTSNINGKQAVNKADSLKAQMKHLDAVIQEKLKLQQILHEQTLSKSIEGNAQVQSELQRHVRAQRCLNKKIKKEMIEIVNKLEKRTVELKGAKKLLERELKDVIKDNDYYKQNLKHFCTKVINLAEVGSEASVNRECKINS